MVKTIFETIGEIGHSYSEYVDKITDLFDKGLATGSVQNDQKLSATKINISRIKRLDKKYVVSSELRDVVMQLPAMTWVVFSEGWCGDSAQCVPVINKIAEVNPFIDLKIILRDDNMDLMNQYLTNGTASIPKLITFDKHGRELFTWGARPSKIQEKVIEYKNKFTLKDKDEFNKNLHLWYAKDRGTSLEEDFIKLLNSF